MNEDLVQADSGAASSFEQSPDELRASVFEALRNALENGYDFSSWSDEEIALDIVDCTWFGVDYSPEALLPFVQDYRRNDGRPDEAVSSAGRLNQTSQAQEDGT